MSAVLELVIPQPKTKPQVQPCLPKKVIMVDMDDTLCDFMGAAIADLRDDPSIKWPQSIPGFFQKLKLIDGAFRCFRELEEHYEMWILTRPSIKNLHCFTEKAQWIELYFGHDQLTRMIISTDKAKIKAEYLIDDVEWKHFEGEQIHFKQWPFQTWDDIVDYLFAKDGFKRNNTSS